MNKSIICPTAEGVPVSAAIYGCAGLELTDDERRFFAKHNPIGFILFARNIDNPAQVKALVDAMRASVGGRDILVLIDQEGGRVARLKPPHWRQYPNARTLAEESEEAVYSGARLIADELLPLGINVDCLPLADVPVEGSHDIIGDRAYATNPQDVARFARKAAEGLRDGGVLPVLKHIPGHGRAMVDSHEDLPVVSASLEELERTDFIPFKALNDLPLGMTAHVLYEALDKENVATLSATVIRYIREQIGFDGLLMSDDISMKALNGDFADLSHRTLVAGCDLVLHCNGDMAEMEAIASAVSPLSDAAKRRAQHAWKQGALRQPFDVAAAEARIHALLAESA